MIINIDQLTDVDIDELDHYVKLEQDFIGYKGGKSRKKRYKY